MSLPVFSRGLIIREVVVLVFSLVPHNDIRVYQTNRRP